MVSQPTLLLTRPEPQSRAFLADCEKGLGKGIPALISPIIGIEDLGEVPDLAQFRAIVVTSGNGVRRLGSRLAGRTVYAVGEATAALARDHGARATALGMDVEGFLASADTVEGPVLYCRGRHSRGELARRLAERGVAVQEAVLYDQVPLPLGPEARRLLAGPSLVIAPVFSPLSAALLSEYVITAPLLMLAISPAVADAWHGPGEIRVADAPTSAALQRMVAEAF